MDIDADRARANCNNWRNRGPAQGRMVQVQDEQGNIFQMRVTQTQTPTRPTQLRGACYECNQVRHFARNCPNRKRRPPRVATAQLVNWSPEDNLTEESDQDRVAMITTQLANLSLDLRDQVTAKFGGGVAADEEGNFPDA
jgi:hypothetical protein